MKKNDNAVSRTVDNSAEMAKRYSAEFKRFVNVELNSEDKERFIEWASANNFFEIMEKHTRLGRSFGVKLDFKQNCFLAYAMERDTKSPNSGLMVSARAASPDMAQWRLLYILDAIFSEGKWDGLVDLSGDLW